jgi:hypothetical protein
MWLWTYWQLPTHYQVHCSSDDLLIWILRVDQRQHSPSSLNDLTLLVLTVFSRDARLRKRGGAEIKSTIDIEPRLTIYVSPQPPSSICLLVRNSHARRTLLELLCDSPASDRLSKANIVA